jgi:hypothetical protein
MELLSSLVSKTPQHPDTDVLIVAGDISEDLQVVKGLEGITLCSIPRHIHAVATSFSNYFLLPR